MKRTTLISALSALAICMAAVPSHALELGGRVLYWFPGFKADMKADASGLAGSDLNLKDHLGVGTEYYPSFELYGGLGRHRVTLSYTPVSYEGSTTPSAPITFKGEVFAAGSEVRTDVDLKIVDLEYEYRFLDMENILAGFSLGAIGKVKYLDGQASLSSPTRGASDSQQLPIPMVGLSAHVGILLNILEARAKVTGIGYSDNYLLEALADVSWTPLPFVDLHAGYKVLRLRIDQDDFFFNSEFTGPYVGITVGF